MQLNQSDIQHIEDYVLAQANRDDIYAMAFNILTNNGTFNSDRWQRVINAIPTAYGYFSEVERQNDNEAFNSAIQYTTYFASVKIIRDEASILNSLNDQEFEKLRELDAQRDAYENVLVEYSQVSSRTNFDNRDNRDNRSTLGGNSTVSRTLGMGNQLNGMRERQQELNEPMTNNVVNSRVSKMQVGLSEASVQTATQPIHQNATSQIPPTSRYAKAAKKEEEVKVVEKEYTVMSTEDFNLDKYPDHFELSYMRKGKDKAQEDIKEKIIEGLLDEQSRTPGVYQNSMMLKNVQESAQEPLVIQVPISNNLNYTLRQARDLSEENLDKFALEIQSVIHKPIIISDTKEIMDFLVSCPIEDIVNSENMEVMFKHILDIRKGGTRFDIAVNNLFSKISQIAIFDLINNAIPEVITSNDVVSDWPEIKKSVLDYLISKTLSNSHYNSNREQIKTTCSNNLDIFITENFEHVRDLISCLVTENSIEKEELDVIKMLWGITDEFEAIYQRTTVSILDIPMSSSTLDLYVNNRETFKLKQTNAKTFFNIVDGFVARTQQLENIDIDFMYVTFSERELYRITKVNESEHVYYYTLTLSNDIV